MKDTDGAVLEFNKNGVCAFKGFAYGLVSAKRFPKLWKTSHTDGPHTVHYSSIWEHPVRRGRQGHPVAQWPTHKMSKVVVRENESRKSKGSCVFVFFFYSPHTSI